MKTMLMFFMTLADASAIQSTVDDAIIRRIGAGDTEAFRRLYELASGSVYGFALSITKNTHDAEDVLQDTFLTVHKNAAAYQPMGKPMAWIFTIARNCALMKLRERGKVVYLEDKAEEQAEMASATAPEDRILIQALLDNLESEERQIVMLHAVSGLKNREIAALLELPMGTVLSKYHRAIKKLRTAAGEEGLFT